MTDTKHTMPSYGVWHVTTEGDCEGRTTRNLGVHQGYLDDIAFALASQAVYGLRFKREELSSYARHAPLTQVNISLDIDTKTWDMHPEQRVTYFRNLLQGRRVSVKESNYYASVTLVRGTTPEEQKAARNAALAASARAKLTPEELAALGLK